MLEVLAAAFESPTASHIADALMDMSVDQVVHIIQTDLTMVVHISDANTSGRDLYCIGYVHVWMWIYAHIRVLLTCFPVWVDCVSAHHRRLSLSTHFIISYCTPHIIHHRTHRNCDLQCLSAGTVLPRSSSFLPWLRHGDRLGLPFHCDVMNGHNCWTALFLRHCGNKSIAVDHTWQAYLKTYGPSHFHRCTGWEPTDNWGNRWQ